MDEVKRTRHDTICDACLDEYMGPNENRTLLDLVQVVCPHLTPIELTVGWTSADFLTWYGGMLNKRHSTAKQEKIVHTFGGHQKGDA